jgi:hypothetical protein
VLHVGFHSGCLFDFVHGTAFDDLHIREEGVSDFILAVVKVRWLCVRGRRWRSDKILSRLLDCFVPYFDVQIRSMTNLTSARAVCVARRGRGDSRDNDCVSLTSVGM